MVTIAHAVCDERGRARGGCPGNQTANLYHTQGELRFAEWYLSGGKPWDYVIRAKKISQRLAIASAAMSAVRNHKIGYDQDDRESLYEEVQYKDFDPARVEKPVNCDCSSLVTVCCNYAKIPILKGTYTGNLVSRCDAVGMFKIYKSKKYTACSDDLFEGDILIREGFHCCIVVNTQYHMTRMLKMGVSGEDVLYLQQLLNKYASGLKEDGEFGIHTDNALRKYQSLFRLASDGVMGPLTAAHMGFLWR